MARRRINLKGLPSRVVRRFLKVGHVFSKDHKVDRTRKGTRLNHVIPTTRLHHKVANFRVGVRSISRQIGACVVYRF